MLENIIRQDIQAMSAYAVAQVPENCLKLDSMESPFDFPPAMQQELGNILGKTPIRLYPHNPDKSFLTLLRQTFAIPQSAEICLGNGSDELISLITQLVAQENTTVLAIEPTFVMYRINAQLHKMNYVGINTFSNFTLDLDRVLEAIDDYQPALIFIAYPNNPTGVRYQRADVEKIIEKSKGLVVIDEAYGAFSSDSFLNQAGSIDNLIVLRTLSKIGFAGLRLGYACGCANIMNQLAKIVPPYNMNRLSLAAATYALNHYDYILNNINILKAQREIFLAQLEDIENIIPFTSEANFLTIKVPHADKVFEFLLKNKVLIKNLSHAHPLLENCLRITVSTEHDNETVLNLLKQCV